MNLCAIVPVYHHVRTVGAVLDAILAQGLPCLVVDDGNADADARVLQEEVRRRERVELLRLPENGGKGAAIQAGLRLAGKRGYTHALQLDADGQHDTRDIGQFAVLAAEHPEDVIYGVPVYDGSVPKARLYGRYATHIWVWINTLSLDIKDSMCGFRIYPVAATLALMDSHTLPSRMDFDTEVLVRLKWRGVGFHKVPTRVVYLKDGHSNFRLWRDNVRLSWMHTRLFFGMLLRLPILLWRKAAGTRKDSAHWASIGENTWVGGIVFLLHVHRWLGRWPFRVAVFPVVFANWLLRPAVRRASLAYLRRIEACRPDGREPTLWLSLRHVMRFAEALLDKLLAVDGRLPVEGVRMEGREELARVVASGRGAVILTAHMGCVELVQHLADVHGAIALNILVHTRHANKFNRILRALNPGTKARFTEVSDLGPGKAMQLAHRVASGECLIVAGDRVPVGGEAMTAVPFLGSNANFPIGPYILASLFDCPLFLLSCIRERGGYVVRFDRLAERVSLPRQNRSAKLTEHASAYASALERMLVRSPLDWFNFFDFWEEGKVGAGK